MSILGSVNHTKIAIDSQSLGRLMENQEHINTNPEHCSALFFVSNSENKFIN